MKKKEIYSFLGATPLTNCRKVAGEREREQSEAPGIERRI